MHFPCPLHGSRSAKAVSKNDGSRGVIASIWEDTFPLGLWRRRFYERDRQCDSHLNAFLNPQQSHTTPNSCREYLQAVRRLTLLFNVKLASDI